MYIHQTFELLAGFCPWWAEEPSTLRPYPVIAKKMANPALKKLNKTRNNNMKVVSMLFINAMLLANNSY